MKTGERFRVDQLLRSAAEAAPDKIALKAGGAALTFGELNSLADRVASVLVEQGVRIGDRVGVHLEKSLEAVASLYGVMRAGAAYVPIDPAMPARRAAYLATNCAIAALVSDQQLIQGLREIDSSAAPGGIVCDGKADEFVPWADVEGTDARALDRPVTDVDLAYILYTSGSTGAPKGVAISHRSCLAFVKWAQARLGLEGDDVFSNHAPFHFDLSTLDLFGSAAAGATVSLVPSSAAMFPARLAEWIREEGISVWYSVPSALAMLVRYADLESRPLPSLRLVLFAGEVFPVRYLSELMRLVPQARYFNLYGPTETNVCTYEEIAEPPDPEGSPVAIGKACENYRCEVVDDEGQPITGAGGEGELIARGSGVAGGYWGDPEATARGFPDAFTYRTGDVVEILDDSENPRYRFVGRRDHMIKTRGYRVELGEIEAALYGHPAVTECVAVAVPDELMTNRIVAFCTTRDPVEPEQLTHFCRDRIPTYMIPSQILFDNALPKTSNDKYDRTTLAERAAKMTAGA